MDMTLRIGGGRYLARECDEEPREPEPLENRTASAFEAITLTTTWPTSSGATSA
jgi:hypothetical protein